MQENGEVCWKMENYAKMENQVEKLRIVAKVKRKKDRRQKVEEKRNRIEGEEKKERGEGGKREGRGKKDQRGMYRTESMTKDKSDKIGQTDKL